MKKIFLILILILFSFSLSAQIFDENETISNKARRAAQNLAGCEPLPLTNSTPLELVKREELDLGFRFGIIDNAGSGTYSFTTDNYDLVGSLNFNKIIFAYAWYGQRHVFHTEYKGSSTDPEWHYKYLMAGLGWYITPRFKIFAGLGQVTEYQNDGDSVDYGGINEKGVAYDIPIYGYKLEIGYRIVEVPLSTDRDIPVDEAPAQGNFEAFSVGFTAPFSLW